ncbi:succinate dehydrogenase [Porphyromonas levii]|uniref:succinate dehydrogenase n=1 Tax=Porphyromonas levii TaxID=28114 RepID=UPI0004758DE1|nr:succinate dehydrogenase [Porphyromonas levii]MBR8703952.1 hypothetical protein [Porphyromonas levii]MBR8731086.1 hypothetical protein [Porphyromonas levii]MBR8766147.1 hypothetical protein [Porphyromonas levii]MBR8803376.1 hypothetical protein [Porphyromonas levii]
MWLTKSSIGRKVVMSLSGLFLIIFLLFHATMNLVAVFSKSGYDMITGFLGTNAIVQFMVPVLALGVIVHVIYAVMLTLQNQKARGNDKYDKTGKTGVQWASKNMFVLGLIVFFGIAWHLTHFWAKMQLREWSGVAPENGFELILMQFSNPIVVALYVVWFVAIWYHLTHGFWSAFQTLGWSNTIWYKRLHIVGVVVATIICLMFACTAVAFYLFPETVGTIWTLGQHATEAVATI